MHDRNLQDVKPLLHPAPHGPWTTLVCYPCGFPGTWRSQPTPWSWKDTDEWWPLHLLRLNILSLLLCSLSLNLNSKIAVNDEQIYLLMLLDTVSVLLIGSFSITVHPPDLISCPVSRLVSSMALFSWATTMSRLSLSHLWCHDPTFSLDVPKLVWLWPRNMLHNPCVQLQTRRTMSPGHLDCIHQPAPSTWCASLSCPSSLTRRSFLSVGSNRGTISGLKVDYCNVKIEKFRQIPQKLT